MIRFRPLGPEDQDRLWDWLHIALWDPPPAALRPREILEAPGVRIYAEHWGRPSDLGVVIRVDGDDAGACWMRLLPPGEGLAYMDAATPQLGIALLEQFRGRGLGERLMRTALARAGAAGYRRVALTVHPQNPAVSMYERCGFERRETRDGYYLMVATHDQWAVGQ